MIQIGQSLLFALDNTLYRGNQKLYLETTTDKRVVYSTENQQTQNSITLTYENIAMTRKVFVRCVSLTNSKEKSKYL